MKFLPGAGLRKDASCFYVTTEAEHKVPNGTSTAVDFGMLYLYLLFGSLQRVACDGSDTQSAQADWNFQVKNLKMRIRKLQLYQCKPKTDVY